MNIEVLNAKSGVSNGTYEYSSNELIVLNMSATLLDFRGNPSAEYLFSKVKNANNWKLPTNPVHTKTMQQAQKLAEAIIFYVGGAEITTYCDNRYLVTSKGYYHYIKM